MCMKESILYNIYQSGKYLSLLLFFLIACDDLEDKPSLVPGESGDVYETGTAEMYILSEGLFNQNRTTAHWPAILSISRNVPAIISVQTTNGD